MPPTGDTPAPRRRRTDAALNRTKLVEAARLVLADDHDASVARIAKAAGVGRGTAYRHFATRDDLVEAVRRQARDDHEANDDDALRPPGELAHLAPSQLSVTDILNKVPPFLLGEQLVAEAQRLQGVGAAALYLVDLDGSTMQRLAGTSTFPLQLAVPMAVGPEIPREGIAPLRAALEDRLPGVTVAPLFLRGRATGVLLAVGAPDDALRDLAAEAAAALALADDYTDAIGAARRVRPTSPAAEIQQDLLPPRIVRIAGALLAGNVLPGYDLGGDWFDYTDNGDGAWIAIADAEGTGTRAAALGAVLLGAFRAARHTAEDPAAVVGAMHETLLEVGVGRVTATATIARWNPVTATVSWLTCGGPAPVLITADGTLEVLGGGVLPALGADPQPVDPPVQQRRIHPGDRLLLLSDGVLGRPCTGGGTLGLEGIAEAVRRAPAASSSGALRAIEDAVRDAIADPLSDDATLVVLVPTASRRAVDRPA